MDLKKIDLKILKDVIFEISKNDDTIFNEMAKIKKINTELFKEHVLILENLGLLESQDTFMLSAGVEFLTIKFKQRQETIQKIASILDNIEFSQFLKSQFYKENVNDYCMNLINSLKEQDLYPLPDAEYMDYALKNSPSVVRYFLVDNDINTLKSFYHRCISSTNEKITDRKRLELLEKCHMYLIWENVIFGKIQDDKHNNVIVEPVPYFTGYLPIAKKSFERLLELYKMMEQEPEGKSSLMNYLKSVVSSK